MGSFSFWHILILAIIILLLFGGNRFSAMMGDVAKGLKSFKKGMSEDEEERVDDRSRESGSLPRNQDRPIEVTPERSRTEEPAARPHDDR